MMIFQAIFEVLDFIARIIGWGFLLVFIPCFSILGSLFVVEVFNRVKVAFKKHKEGREGRPLARVLARWKRREEYSENDSSIVLNQDCPHCLIPLDAHNHCAMCKRQFMLGIK